jgi:hypothetical protein
MIKNYLWIEDWLFGEAHLVTVIFGTKLPELLNLNPHLT